MKRIAIILISIIILLTITSCDIENMEISENITPPKNNNLPLYGEWIIEDYIVGATSTMDEEKAEDYIGLEAIFHEKLVTIGEKYCLKPQFKTMNVNSSEYLIYNYKVNPDSLGIESEEIQVISISGVDQFFNEFIKLSQDEAIVNIDGVFFYLNRVSELVDENKIESLSIPQEINTEADKELENAEEVQSSGILLGLKSLNMNEGEELENWDYRTVFIQTLDKEIISINEMKDILLPRRNGFWKVEVNREQNDDNIEDNIEIYPLVKSKDENDKIMMFEDKKEDNPTLKNILYVGNDYISIENIHYNNKGQRYLEFYPVDTINSNTPIKISDLIGEAGKEALVDGFNKEIVAKDEEYRSDYVDLTPEEDSFGLFRRNGLWIFKGRFNYMDEGNYMYKDFNIEALPTKELVSFDELSIPWNAVKEKIPQALDAFTSPNEDIAVVITYDSILVYQIENEDLANEPLEEIKLKSGERVVMAEWAVGKYSQIWEEQFK